MASEKNTSVAPQLSNSTSRLASPPPPGLRQRPLGRAATFAENSVPANQRRGSLLSDSFSETRKSFRSSTDDLFLPRVRDSDTIHNDDDASHWHSLPLVLALLPAVGGLLFKDGSAVVTDVTLLGLAAIFLNWALRMPWDWYRGAQSTTTTGSPSPSVFSPIDEEDETQLEDNDNVSNSNADNATDTKPNSEAKAEPTDSARLSAQKELRVHEFVALMACFFFPMLGAWLLHAIRSQLSRPSEGLVSNYNLTIFLLVAEIRPISHLIKMVQRRTLFLQRKVNADPLPEVGQKQMPNIQDLINRVGDLESHIADGIAANESRPVEPLEDVAAKVSAQASSDMKKSVQPELDALGRAMRRYEKRTTVTAVQIETRLQDLETRLKDVVAIAAAAQRNSEHRSPNYTTIFTNWISAAFVIPVQSVVYVLNVPNRVLSTLIRLPRRIASATERPKKQKENRNPKRGTTPRPSERGQKLKTPP